MATVIEYVHRLTSGLSGVLVLVELVWAFVALPRRHPARAGAVRDARSGVRAHDSCAAIRAVAERLTGPPLR